MPQADPNTSSDSNQTLNYAPHPTTTPLEQVFLSWCAPPSWLVLAVMGICSLVGLFIFVCFVPKGSLPARMVLGALAGAQFALFGFVLFAITSGLIYHTLRFIRLLRKLLRL